MASSKDMFEAHMWRANMFGAGLWRGSLNIISGPFYVDAGQVFAPGAIEGDIHRPGAAAAEIFQSGAIAGQIN